MIIKFIKWFNNKTGYRYWYQIKIHYSNNNKCLFDFYREIGVIHKSQILKHRTIKKVFVPLHKMNLPKSILCNGIVYYTTICYLGYFKK